MEEAHLRTKKNKQRWLFYALCVVFIVGFVAGLAFFFGLKEGSGEHASVEDTNSPSNIG